MTSVPESSCQWSSTESTRVVGFELTNHDPWILKNTSWEHRILSTLPLPKTERNHHRHTHKQRSKRMRIRPLILVSTPEQSRNKEDKAAYTQEASHEIDLCNCLSACETHRIDSRWWEVVEEDHQESEEIPNSADKSTPPPRRVISDELSIKHTRCERHNSKHQHTNILPPLRRRRQLTRGSQCRELINTSAGS